MPGRIDARPGTVARRHRPGGQRPLGASTWRGLPGPRERRPAAIREARARRQARGRSGRGARQKKG
jgi:hypothetical protein